MNTLTQNELQFLCKSLKQYFGELSSTSQSFMDSSQETSTIDDQNAAFFDSLLNKKPSQKAVNKVFKVSDDNEYNDDINNEWWRSIPNNPPQQPPRPKPSEFYNQLNIRHYLTKRQHWDNNQENSIYFAVTVTYNYKPASTTS